MPSHTREMRAIDLTNVADPYQFRVVDGDGPWSLVRTRAVCELTPHQQDDLAGGFLPELVTVTCADGTQRFLNPDDRVEIGFD